MCGLCSHRLRLALPERSLCTIQACTYTLHIRRRRSPQGSTAPGGTLWRAGPREGGRGRLAARSPWPRWEPRGGRGRGALPARPSGSGTRAPTASPERPGCEIRLGQQGARHETDRDCVLRTFQACFAALGNPRDNPSSDQIWAFCAFADARVKTQPGGGKGLAHDAACDGIVE